MPAKIMVAKSGKNVFTSTNPNDYIFHSDYNTFKILATGKLTSQSVTGSPTTFTFAHGQSSIPAVYAFAKFADGYTALPDEKERADVHPVDRYWRVEMDSTYVYFMFYKGSSANYSVNIRYYIFETPGS